MIPEPMITVDADAGKASVERWQAMSAGGSCQYEIVGSGLGKPGAIEARDSIESICD